LVELMVAVAVVAILAVVALPAYFESVRKSRRAEAIAALTAVQQAQERRRANESTYTDDLGLLGIASDTTASGFYTLAVTNPGAGGYTVTATAASDSSQAKDEKCFAMRVRVAAGNIFYVSAVRGATIGNTGDANRCWSRQ